MVLLFNANEGLFASHLPLYAHPHNYQIIYKVTLDNPQRLTPLFEKGLVTVLPENFDLARLINGERFSLSTTFFEGHFERGGKAIFSAQLHFELQILSEQVEPSFSANNALFYRIAISDNTAVVAHKIQSAPSFDAIGFINITQKENSTPLSCDQPIAREANIIKKHFAQCLDASFDYIETQDFN
ncbi:hypothetical protein [Thalassotalea sp. PLHSN55]|uniref:hypothetical protein n=1 Tax=Thalassotalea sp. PLHSN55 TaxID=3435888 RepID=UPI003F872DEF